MPRTATARTVKGAEHSHRFLEGDALRLPVDDNSVDLVLGSPPYENKRTYGIGFKLTGDEWVQWTADRFVEACRVSRGLVVFVVDGKTERFRYSCVPELLIAELHRRGVFLRRPAIYSRWGVPGSGGPDYLKARAETIVVGSRERGRLAWADPTAGEDPPKFREGGQPSHRTRDGRRVSNWTDQSRRASGQRRKQRYVHPQRVNPGNIIDCGAAGGNNIGHALAHENEAPFPLKLAEFWVRKFCLPGGTVLDPFGGSGTTAHAAENWGRASISVDIRASQVELGAKRLREVLKAGGTA